MFNVGWWNNITPQNLTYTSSATANNIQLDENKNAVIDLSFGLGGYIGDYKTYEKPNRYIEIELPRGVTFAGEDRVLREDKTAGYYYVTAGIYYYGSSINIEMNKNSNVGRILLQKQELNYYYLHFDISNIKLNVDTSVYKEDYLTFKVGGNTLTASKQIPRG
ncbi:hypothetical protein EVG22_15270 [Bacillus thuringiensis serovar andalousiensis]|uniref:Uncharacterized protein n=1 Tax=Bacillus thuringiensis serovar andalousiensis TaxID=257985 RepID=A0A6H0TPW2_BACTU|nr:hypothetical protein EVG22_15270 [Bacillus thuringiensis serovar andalousiensis]